MRQDSIMREVRRIKDEMAAKYGYDVRALGKAIQEAERRDERKPVIRRPKGAKAK
jgi:hypothetical protein